MEMNMRYILTAALIMGSMSCKPIRQSIHDTLYGSPAAGQTSDNTTRVEQHSNTTITVISSHQEVHSSSGGNFLRNAAALAAAENALRNLPAFAGKQIAVYEAIHFYDDGRINLELQHPTRTDYIDAYRFNKGSWQEPAPVQLSVHDDIKAGLLNLDKVHFANVATIYNNYRLKADSIEGVAPLTHIYAIIRGDSITWYPRSISGSRERYFISFTAAGNVDRFYRE
ncbi:hypothetical protein FHW36_102620 [Chitinophaga polysaccharea]|uniref:Lipoprotein n=1 Tax=Chitinophaga polysaccharea TaxID=1293035 RepID=A0A561PXN0_9BACT|nr:hypothetical protein [Chitinophaga polysaccharea]TWF42859.1 hypothetical protein FHW36_102620 [Chitinophaga polysaccharea]